MSTPTQKPTISLYYSFSPLLGYFLLSSIIKFRHQDSIIMVDYQIVCSMCGDVGFPDKIFRCSKCCNRFQHSYCSNYYRESSEPIEVCDWCKSEDRSSARHGGSSSRKSSAGNGAGMTKRSEYSGERIKQNDREEGSERGGKNPSGAPSPRTSTRRYKLLKDVMC